MDDETLKLLERTVTAVYTTLHRQASLDSPFRATARAFAQEADIVVRKERAARAEPPHITLERFDAIPWVDHKFDALPRYQSTYEKDVDGINRIAATITDTVIHCRFCGLDKSSFSAPSFVHSVADRCVVATRNALAAKQ